LATHQYATISKIKKTFITRKALNISEMVGVLGTNWNQIKLELLTMWQIVKQVREETGVVV
jgi:hypothetical protein